MAKTKVGFIGLGAIGRPMAVHVARHFDCAVWNRTAERAHSFGEETGARVAATPAEAIAAAAAVFTCLPTSREVRDVIERDDNGWQSGQLVIDATSGDPATARNTSAWLAERGVGFVDAPVSGGTAGAEAGKLTVMLGGSPENYERANPFIDVYAGKVVHVGPVGAGNAVKAVNQALLAVNIEAAGEGLAALVKQGVSAQTALDVINASSGRSNVTQNLVPERVITRAWLRTFRLALLDKDVGIALDMLTESGVPHETVAAAKRAMERARKELGEEADHVEAIKVIEREAGVEIR